MPACFARMGPAGLKNWAAKNLWEVLSNHPGDFYSVPRQVIGLPNVGCPSACLKTNCFHTNNKGHGNEEV